MRGNRSSKIALAVLVLVACGVAAQGQPAFRVKDLNTTRTGDVSSEYGANAFMDRFVAAAGTVYFGASDGIHGFEPWRSDGTAAGTRPVADVCPGSCASLPHGFAVVGRNLFFIADDGFHGPELWKSDGTPAGTAMVRDLLGAADPGYLHGLTALNGRLLFSITYSDRGELWQSDGTAAGTLRLARFVGDSSSSYDLEPLGRLGRRLFFVAGDREHGREIWMTDGTTAGTTLLKDVNPGPSGSAFGNLDKTAAVAGGKLFFLAIGPQGAEPWVSDGTTAGTVPVGAPGPSGYVLRELVAWGREVAFFASTDGQSLSLWRSDGTTRGTRAIKKVPGIANFLSYVGGRLFFFAGCELWTSNGTAAGTLRVTQIGGGPSCSYNQPIPLTDQGGLKFLFFADDGIHGKEPWKSDGTAAGTTMVADLFPGAAAAEAESGVFAGGRWYFRAKGGENAGVQLWTTDGTAAGTRMLAINRQKSGLHVDGSGGLVGPGAFFDANGTLLFQGGDGATGAELAKSDGTAAGTRVVKDLQPGAAASLPGELIRVGGAVFFRTGAGTGAEKLWRTDGTAAGTELLFAPGHLHFGGLFSPRDLTPLGDRLVFAGSWWDDFSESLLASDGTAAGTGPLGTSFAIYSVRSVVPLHRDRVLFQAEERLWTSDGTDAGTMPLSAAPTLSPWQWLRGRSALRDGVLLFVGSTPDSGEELWASDGTEAGTRQLADIVPGPDSKPLGPFAVAGPTVFFAAGGDELWKNDASGTTLVRRLPPGDPAFGIRSLTALGNKVYFTYHDDKQGHELWTSDGTAEGTARVKDILPGAGSSHPRFLRVVGSHLLFSASDGLHGHEPWQSDGTGTGTRMIQDLAPGSESSSPSEFTASGANVYFTANDGTSGFELWAVPRTALAAAVARDRD